MAHRYTLLSVITSTPLTMIYSVCFFFIAVCASPFSYSFVCITIFAFYKVRVIDKEIVFNYLFTHNVILKGKTFAQRLIIGMRQ